MSTEYIVALVIGVVVVLYLVATYNKLIQLRNRFKNAFAQIDVQLQRRYDLIPNLIATAKEFMRHEQETLEKVIQARNTAQAAKNKASAHPEVGANIKALMAAEQGLSNGLGGFFGLSENYPDLKANQNMMQLSEELTSTENKISLARQAYNDAVMLYNTKREGIPTVFVANLCGFVTAESFVVEDAKVKQAVKVSF